MKVRVPAGWGEEPAYAEVEAGWAEAAQGAAVKKQCAKCPWRKSTNPRDIPNGYCEMKHRNLAGTIAKPGALNPGPILMMACHESKLGEERVCVGWAVNQLGPGNNIGLRLLAMKDETLQGLEVAGPQHARFEDTLPKGARSGPEPTNPRRRRCD